MNENSISISNCSDVIDVREMEIRCSGVREDGKTCNKFLTKVFIYVSVPHEIKEEMEKKNMTVSQTIKGLEIKVGLETKCNRCKNFDYKMHVI